MLENISQHLRWGWLYFSIVLAVYLLSLLTTLCTLCCSFLHWRLRPFPIFPLYFSFVCFAMSKLSLWELQRAVLCWKHRFSWLCLDIFWEPGGWMLFTECYLQTCLNGLSLNAQLPWIYTLHGWGPCNKQISWICEHTMIFKVFQMLLDEINLKNRGKNININFPPCITLQEKEERSHPHEGARQCCSPSPSGVLQKSSFQFQLRPLRSTLQWESLQGKHQTTHLLQVWSLTPPLLLLLPQWSVYQNCYRPGTNRITRYNCHCPPDSLKIFRLHFFSFSGMFHMDT